MSRVGTPCASDDEWHTRHTPMPVRIDREWSDTMAAARVFLVWALLLLFYVVQRKNALKTLEKLKNRPNPVLDECRETFNENECGRKDVEPALVEICRKARACLRQKPALPSVASIIFSNLGEACNEFLSNLAPSTVTTILVILCVVITVKRYI